MEIMNYKVFGLTRNSNLQSIVLGGVTVAAVFANQSDAAKVLLTFDNPEEYEITKMEVSHVF